MKHMKYMTTLLDRGALIIRMTHKKVTYFQFLRGPIVFLTRL